MNHNMSDNLHSPLHYLLPQTLANLGPGKSGLCLFGYLRTCQSQNKKKQKNTSCKGATTSWINNSLTTCVRFFVFLIQPNLSRCHFFLPSHLTFCKGTHTQHQTATLRWKTSISGTSCWANTNAFLCMDSNKIRRFFGHNEIYNYTSWHLWLSYIYLGLFWGSPIA